MAAIRIRIRVIKNCDKCMYSTMLSISGRAGEIPLDVLHAYYTEAHYEACRDTSLAAVYNANISIQNGIQQTLTMMVDQRSGHTYIIYIIYRNITPFDELGWITPATPTSL